MPIAFEDWKAVGESSGTPSILTKAFDVLGAFDERDRVLTLTDISRKIGLPKSTVHRLVNRLVEINVIEAQEHGYKVGVRLLNVVSTIPANGMRDIALPHIARLQAFAKGAVHLAVPRSGSVVVLEMLTVQGPNILVGPAGSRLPAHLTALGRAMLAHMNDEIQDEILDRPLFAMTPKSKTDAGLIRAEFPAIRRSKVAISKDEVAMGLGTIASPILIKGRAVGAVSIQFDSATEPSEPQINAVRVVAQRISKETFNMLANGNSKLFPHEF